MALEQYSFPPCAMGERLHTALKLRPVGIDANWHFVRVSWAGWGSQFLSFWSKMCTLSNKEHILMCIFPFRFSPFLCVYVHACTKACSYVHVEARGWCWVLSSVALHLSCFSATENQHELINFSRLTCQLAPDILLCQSRQCYADYRCAFCISIFLPGD